MCIRDRLYVKDDDYRLSFLHGNYISLTNLSPADWERIAEPVSYTHLRAHETVLDLVCRLLLEKKKE